MTLGNEEWTRFLQKHGLLFMTGPFAPLYDMLEDLVLIGGETFITNAGESMCLVRFKGTDDPSTQYELMLTNGDQITFKQNRKHICMLFKGAPNGYLYGEITDISHLRDFINGWIPFIRKWAKQGQIQTYKGEE